MTPDDMFIVCLLIATWCIMFYISSKHQRLFYGFTLVISLFMIEFIGWLSLFFIGISAYFVLDYLINNFF